MSDRLEEFQKLRSNLPEEILAGGHLGIKRFFALDHRACEPGLLGLVVSTVLRCEECIGYPLVRGAEEG